MHLLGRISRGIRARSNRRRSIGQHRRIVALTFDRPIVSFTFDDFPASAYRVGGMLLRERGWRGTYYTSLSLMGTDTICGRQYDLEDLQGAVQDGHEIACHTFGHVVGRKTRAEDYARDVQENSRQRSQVLTSSAPFRSFAYPEGDVTPQLKQHLAGSFSSLRGIFKGIHSAAADLNLLRANCLYSRRASVASRAALIRKNRQRCGWLIFYTHDVCERPSPFGCTPEYFAEVLQLTRASQAQVRPVSEVVAMLSDNQPAAGEPSRGAESCRSSRR